MQTLILKIDTSAHAAQLSNFLKALPYIKSIIAKKNTGALKLLTTADWVRPGRPATDEEIERMLDECEAQEATAQYFTAKQVKQNAMNRLKEWRRKTSK